jgi:hypothetical protein
MIQMRGAKSCDEPTRCCAQRWQLAPSARIDAKFSNVESQIKSAASRCQLTVMKPD